MYGTAAGECARCGRFAWINDAWLCQSCATAAARAACESAGEHVPAPDGVTCGVCEWLECGTCGRYALGDPHMPCAGCVDDATPREGWTLYGVGGGDTAWLYGDPAGRHVLATALGGGRAGWCDVVGYCGPGCGGHTGSPSRPWEYMAPGEAAVFVRGIVPVWADARCGDVAPE